MPGNLKELPPRRAPFRRGLSVVVAALLVACTDNAEVPVTGPVLSSRASVVSSPDLASWNAYEADVDISIVGSDDARFNRRGVSRGVSYKITRRRAKTGEWVSVQEFGSLLPAFPGATPGLGVPSIARSIDRGDGSPIEYYDSRGKRVQVPTFIMPVLPTRGAVKGRVLGVPLPTIPTVDGPSPAAKGDTSSTWIDRFIVTPLGASRERSRLERTFGLPSRMASGAFGFRSVKGANETEVIVGSETGLVETVRVRHNGTLVSEITREYSAQPGAFVLSRERLIRMDSTGKPTAQVVTTRYRNIRIMEDK